MGHFGRTPIRLTWSAWSSAWCLNYAGQAALVLGGARRSTNIFFRLCPPATLLADGDSAHVATIHRQPSIITGAFSRRVKPSRWAGCRACDQADSQEGYGQIT